MLKPGLIVAAALAIAGAQDTHNWGSVPDDPGEIFPRFAQSRAICRKLGPPRPPAADRPTATQRRALAGCDPGKLYYGYGARPDYTRARLCAMAHAEPEGTAILMQLYANGRGVKRDPDLATAYACEIEGAPAERHGRVLHMQQLKTNREKDVDFCDDITSGLAGGYCAARHEALAAVARDVRLKAITARLPPAATALYPAMKNAFDAFVEARAYGEIDRSGTGSAGFAIDEMRAIRDQFAIDLGRLSAGRWPVSTTAAARAADAALNARYRAALARTDDAFTTIGPDDIRATQRAWLAYRDRYVRFAAAAAPGVTADSILARLTRLRTAQLEGLSGD